MPVVTWHDPILREMAFYLERQRELSPGAITRWVGRLKQADTSPTPPEPEKAEAAKGRGGKTP